MDTSWIPTLCIAASAGSGKTFALAHRVLRLLAMGVPPDRLGAYTFSRKAAGEIFDEVVRYLCAAAASEQAAALTASRMEFPRDQAGFLLNLRAMLAQLHRLRIGTLDSRIAQMLTACSLELRLPPDFRLMDGQSPEARLLYERVLDQVFRPGRLSPEAATAFLEAFDQATHGASEKQFDRKLLSFLNDHRSVYLLFPEAEAWGPESGLRLKNPPQPIPDEDRELLADQLLAALPGLANPRIEKALAKEIEKARNFTPGKPWKEAASGKLVEQILADEAPELLYYKKITPVPEPLWHGLRLLFRHPLGVALAAARMQTRGIHGLLHAVSQQLQAESLRLGQISFEDASALMGQRLMLPPDALAFRLDGEIDHWLLDEFQDTSLLQWRAISPLIEEVLQDAEHRRSFFYVGDVKQAIYAWRGGNADLFQQIQDEYPVIQTLPLTESQRSAPAVLDLVNHLLEAPPPDPELPAGALEAWSATYQKHTAAARNANLPGQALVVSAGDPDDKHQISLMAEVLRSLPPGLETAILTRSNQLGADIANGLRALGFSVALEGQSALRSDTAVELILAAFRLASHPGDTFSRKLLEMAGRQIDPAQLRRDVAAKGYAPCVAALTDTLPLTGDTAYSRHRLEQLRDAALRFDAMGGGPLDAFLAFAGEVRLKEHESRGVIRIMTVHQSKGLGFDAVLFPVGEGQMVKVDTNRLATSATGSEPPWVLSMPPKMVCEATDGLREEYQRLENESAYENFCNLYVALTRAKQSLHVLLPPPPKEPGSRRVWHNWMRSRLADAPPVPAAFPSFPQAEILAAWGAPLPPPERKAPPPPPPRLPLPLRAGTPPLPRLEPSRADGQTRRLGPVFRPVPEDGRDLGNQVHALMEQVAWAEESDLPTLLAAGGLAPDSEAARHLANALAMPQLRRPPNARGLWREQSFEVILPEGWITGIFDRVVLLEDGAWIQDFKTNRRVTSATHDHYRPQLHLYRRVLSHMLSLPEASIRCQLLFTGTGDVVDL